MVIMVLSPGMAGVVGPNTTQCYRWVMIPQFDADGLLPPEIHRTTWDEVTTRFGNTPWRRRLLGGLETAIDSLRRAGCRTVYIDGSFVTGKEVPNDFDACWEEGVAPKLLDPCCCNSMPAGRRRRPGTWASCFPPRWEPPWRGCRFSNSSRRIARPEGARA